jgi:hypothetical protein
MATILLSADAKNSPEAEAEAVKSSAGPPLLHFGLRQFLAFVSGIALLLGAMAMIRGGWAVALAFGAAMVAAHVSATFIGTRLRESSRRGERARIERGGEGEEFAGRFGRLSPAELAALTATPLARHERAPLRTLLAAASGLLLGAFLGAMGLPLLAGPDANGAGIAVGAVSVGVMGAWLALLAAHFWSVTRRTWRDAKGIAPATEKHRRPRIAP